MMGEMHVVKPGLLTTVQDLGRWGFQAQGVSVAGPMDAYSHRLANALVGNAARAATLEATMLGPDLEFDDERMIAVTGGVFDVRLDRQAVPNGTVLSAKRGSLLSVGPRRSGTRAYIAISGGVGVPEVLGSRSTHVLTRLGGFDGRPLKAGDRVPLGEAAPAARLSVAPVSVVGAPARLRVLPGLHRDRFSDDAFRALLAGSYSVARDSDRVGFRLEGVPIPGEHPVDMISDATPMGTIQISGAGLPILLMADRQTTGGYAQIATVIAADLPVAGQLGPGDSLTFAACLRAEAMSALIARERSLLAIERLGPL
jgi:antagonist of KipI